MSYKYLKSIEEASQVIGKTWPLYSFVTSNPLSGYEKMPFLKAVSHAEYFLDADVFPKASVFREAFNKGEINGTELKKLLEEKGFNNTPEFYLDLLERYKKASHKSKNHDVNRIMAKWLAAFLDEGLAEWQMPQRKLGFYKSWRRLAPYETELGIKNLKEIPKTSEEALTNILQKYNEKEYLNIFTNHLSELPGWVGYINHRNELNTVWQQKYPITLLDYLAVRLWVTNRLNLEIYNIKEQPEVNLEILKLKYIWLKAWENSWQSSLINTLEIKNIDLNGKPKKNSAIPEAQMVFCIDTRSELIRRHIESKGNYETFGYAGFFGIAMDYQNIKDGLQIKSCPPILDSKYITTETPKSIINIKKYKRKNELLISWNYFLRRMKNLLPSAFGYVEGSGVFYGISLVTRSLFPKQGYKFKKKNISELETICEPQLTNTDSDTSLKINISINEKAAIVKSAFDLMGWKQFSPLVLFVGHGSHTANNPFGSSLDCGACAASPGRHNARMLAKLANDKEVRAILINNYNILIPNNTCFIGAEHNTTTDEIILFDSTLPSTHFKSLNKLKASLRKAQESATQERLILNKNSINEAYKKANNWSEVRPEWGLAKNAGFIIGPRELTKSSNYNNRCFLHSYNWELDVNGNALEAIMQGPMVVTQWINNHYYFSSVDNHVFGGGSKIIHNITGKYGVLQGNGGDLKMGLPLQSLYQSDKEIYHQPLRLSVFIQSPIERINDILLKNENLKRLIDNEWIYLFVSDPNKQNETFKYIKELKWNNVMYSNKKENNNIDFEKEKLTIESFSLY